MLNIFFNMKRTSNKVLNAISYIMFFITGVGLIFGGVMIWTVEKSMIPIIPIVFGLAILSVPISRFVRTVFKKNIEFGTTQLVYCCFILVAILFSGLCLWVIGTTVAAMIGGEITYATIDGMSSGGVPYLDYYANGKAYNNVFLGSASLGMHDGEKIMVAYYPDNPERLYHCGATAFIFPVVGLLIFGACAVFFIKLLISPAIKFVEKKTFEINSRTIWGVVDKIEQNVEKLVYDDHPWVIHCSYRADDATFRFKSKELNFDPTFCYNVGDPIQIRVDYNDFTNYEVVVDLTRMAEIITNEEIER